MKNEVFAKFESMLGFLAKKEIMTKESLLKSEYKDEYWCRALALSTLIVGYRRKNINKSDVVWGIEDYRMELAGKVVDKYDRICATYLSDPDKFNINSYITSMLLRMIYDNDRKVIIKKNTCKETEEEPFGRYSFCTISTPLGNSDERFTIEDTLTSDESTEDTCVFRSDVRDSVIKLNRLSSKGPLYAFILHTSGDKDVALQSVHEMNRDFLEVYNNEVDIFCDEFGIQNNEELHAESLSEFARAFSPVNDFDSKQISRWKYMCRNELGPKYGIDISPKQVRKPRVKITDASAMVKCR